MFHLELDQAKLLRIKDLDIIVPGERMGKLAEVPPVRRQIIDEHGNYRQKYGIF